MNQELFESENKTRIITSTKDTLTVNFTSLDSSIRRNKSSSTRGITPISSLS